MTERQKDTLDKWLPTIIQIGVFLVAGGLAWGSLRSEVNGIKELQRIDRVQQQRDRDEMREDIRDLRQRMDSPRSENQ